MVTGDKSLSKEQNQATILARDTKKRQQNRTSRGEMISRKLCSHLCKWVQNKLATDIDVLVPMKTRPHSDEEQQQYDLVTMLPGFLMMDKLINHNEPSMIYNDKA